MIAGRVGQRAVPVEDDEPEPTRREVSGRRHRAAPRCGVESRDEGGEIRRERRLDDDLATVERMRETDAVRVQEHPLQTLSRQRLFQAKSPYLSSPASGKPRCVRWTRIWCVRPVSSSASSSDDRRIGARPRA